MQKLKKYEIYNVITNEVYAWGYNSFTAMSNLVAFRSQYGEENVSVRWVEA